jgi:hypothetical protein
MWRYQPTNGVEGKYAGLQMKQSKKIKISAVQQVRKKAELVGEKQLGSRRSNAGI